MAESEKLETLVYCLGPVGGQMNPVISSGLCFTSKYDYTTKGYKNYITEAKNLIKYHRLVIKYLLDSLKPEYEDPLAFIDEEKDEKLRESIRKMKEQWKEMFQQHQKELREILRKKADEHPSSDPKLAAEVFSEDSSSSSSAKIAKLDLGVAADAGATENTGAAAAAGATGVPVESFNFPESIFVRKAKEFGKILMTEFSDLKSKLEEVLDRIHCDSKVRDLKGFTLLKMRKIAKWKFSLKTLDILVAELEAKFTELDLDFEKRKRNEKRLTDWLYFDDGKKDRKYYHRLLITMDLTGAIDEISTILLKQNRRWWKMNNSMEDRLEEERNAYEKKMVEWKLEVLFGGPIKKNPLTNKESITSVETLDNVEDIPED